MTEPPYQQPGYQPQDPQQYPQQPHYPQYTHYPQYSHYPGPPPYAMYPPAPPTNGMAIAALVVGILWMYWIGSILAVVFGHVALRQIARRGEGGRGLAIAGLTLGYVGVGILVAVLVIVAVSAAVS